jgi:kynureninase
MQPGFVPAAGAAGWQVSNPPVLSAAPLIASLQLFDEAGLAPLRAKSLALHAFLRRALQERCGASLDFVTPAADERHGCQLSLRLRAGVGRRVFEALSRRGIIGDWRDPDILRFSATPLYNSYADVAQLVVALEAALRDAA